MGDPAPRFEFRLFGRALGELRERIVAGADATGSESRDEVYLLGPRRDRNVKIRDASIDVKALRETCGALERWEPVVRVPFPLAGEWVRNTLAGNLGVERLDAPRAAYDVGPLLGEVVEAAPALRAVRVHKERERFSRGKLLAEFARLRGPGRFETVAVESEDPEVARAWVRRLALDRWPNTNYVTWLHHVARAGDA